MSTNDIQVSVLPGATNLSSPVSKINEWFRVESKPYWRHVEVCQMRSCDGYGVNSRPKEVDITFLDRDSAETLVAHLSQWLESTKPEGEDQCSNACTKNSLPPTAPTSESNASNSELTVEMVFQIARSCVQEAILGSSNSSSPVESCGPNKDCGSGI